MKTASEIVAGKKEKLLRPNVVADMLDVNRNTVYRLYHFGDIEGVRVSKRAIRLYESSVVKYLKKLNEL